MSARIYGPWEAGSVGTVDILEGVATASDFITAHTYKRRLYYTVIRA